MKKILAALAAVIAGAALAVFILRSKTQTVVVERDIAAVPVIEVSGVLDRPGARKIICALRRAESTRPALVVISFDSPGGEVSGTLEVADAINGLSVPIVGLVREGAGGTMFMIAAIDQIYFSPNGICGATAPVVTTGDSEIDRTSQKILSHASAKIRGYAESNGHDPTTFLAMMDTSLELVRDGKVWKKKGQLLSLTAKEALAIGLSVGIASSPEEAIAKHREKKAPSPT